VILDSIETRHLGEPKYAKILNIFGESKYAKILNLNITEV